MITDHILPELPNLRFHSGALPIALTEPERSIGPTMFPATGPRSHCLPFEAGSSRMWGTGILPLGWAKFVRRPAIDIANQLVDGMKHSAFASFVPLAQSLFSDEPDVDAELARFIAHFMARLSEPVEDEARISALQNIINNPDTRTVSELVEATGLSQRTLERLCKRHFGFAPKMLLRRQRFMRSIAEYLADPTLKWIGAIDSQYHDQAQFVRDFHEFMGMSPRQYSGHSKPILNAVTRERISHGWVGVQSLERSEPHDMPD